MIRKFFRCESEFRAGPWVKYTLKEVFNFFSDENNLEIVTPPGLTFRASKKKTSQIERWAEIDYRISVHGIFNGLELTHCKLAATASICAFITEEPIPIVAPLASFRGGKRWNFNDDYCSLQSSDGFSGSCG
ncbi:MAG: hypothetical protein WCI18_05450 [Pseudomonadota bacterium]